jgi:HPt (histidine-containing phosphotransfer) domain-containing protein
MSLREKFRESTRVLQRRMKDCRRPAAGSVQPDENLKLQSLGDSFARELLANLLDALPDYRSRMMLAYGRQDFAALRDIVHQLLGAIAYCDDPALEAALRELRLALMSKDLPTIEQPWHRLLHTIDEQLERRNRR